MFPKDTMARRTVLAGKQAREEVTVTVGVGRTLRSCTVRLCALRPEKIRYRKYRDS